MTANSSTPELGRLICAVFRWRCKRSASACDYRPVAGDTTRVGSRVGHLWDRHKRIAT